MLDSLRISQRLWLMAGISSVLFFAAMAAGLHSLYRQQDALEQLDTATEIHLQNLGRIALGVAENTNDVLLAFNQHAPDSVTAAHYDHTVRLHLDTIKARQKGLDQAFLAIINSELEADEQPLARDIGDKQKAWLEKLGAALAALQAGDHSAAPQVAFIRAVGNEGKALQEALDKMKAFQLAEVKGAKHDADALFRQNLMIYGLLIVLGIVGVLGIAFLTIRRIATSMRQAGAVVDGIAAGDLSQEVPDAGNDEIGQILAKMAVMRGNLRDLVGALRGNVASLHQASRDLSTSANRSAQTSEEQSEAASSMAASVEQLSVSIDQVEEHALDARNTTLNSGTQSAEGGRIIHEAAAEMEHIADTVNATAGTIRQLEDFSGQISSIVNVIRDIADQTNLLALNAAIEAARAGEQGRGFAVVADEVRKLAERTGKSTQEITQMINKIQQGTQQAAQEMEAGVQRVNEGVSLARQAGDSVTGIRTGSEQVTRAVDDINLALKEQAVAARDIAQKVERIAQGAEENSATVAQTAASARQLEALAGELQAVAARFRV